MATVDREFDALYNHVLAIDPLIAGSLERIARVRAEVNNAFDDAYIARKQWRVLIDELALLHRKALASVQSKICA